MLGTFGKAEGDLSRIFLLIKIPGSLQPTVQPVTHTGCCVRGETSNPICVS